MGRIPVIGIVGGIGSGKSAVAAAFREAGCVVSDSDSLAHAALRDPVVRDEIVSWWGREVLDAHGEIDRKAVGRIVFSDATERGRLERLVHPWIERERVRAFAAAPAGTKACVIDAPLLLEAGLGPQCDAIVFVDAPRAARSERVQKSRGWSEAEFTRREASQWPIERKRAASTHVVVNDGSVDSMREQVHALVRSLAISASA
ncbi:MAG: dephospho-CoA kinase [Phycisphaerales bacterium]